MSLDKVYVDDIIVNVYRIKSSQCTIKLEGFLPANDFAFIRIIATVLSYLTKL